MEEDITCKFLATTTVLKGVFIFLNSIFVRGYFTFFFFPPFQRAADGWAESLTFSQNTSQQLYHFFPWENGKHLALISLFQLLSPQQRSGQALGQWCLNTLPQGCWSVTFSEMLQHRFSISFLQFTLIISHFQYMLFTPFLFSSNQCHLVIKIFNWIQPKFLLLFVSLFTNGLH